MVVMKRIKIIARWIFAVFVAIASYFCSLVLLALLLSRMQGLPFGTKAPPDFQSPLNPTVFLILGNFMVLFPLVIASYLGAIAVPKAHLRAASIIFPFLVFLLIYIGPSLGSGKWTTSILSLLLNGAACTVAAVFLYFRWKRRASVRIPT
jgi:hypothetical protein